MKIKQTILILAALMGVCGFLFSPVASAATCGGVTTSIISCDQKGGTCEDGTTPVNGGCESGAKYIASAEVKETGLWGLLIVVINILTAGIGVAAVAGVVYSSVLYTSAGGNVEQVKKSRDMLKNTIIGIVTYALMYAGLNFIIPGGMFG